MRRRILAWWPELLLGSLLALFAIWGAAEAVGAYAAGDHAAMTSDSDVVVAAGFTMIVLAVGWGMCARHRRLPLEEKVDDLAGQIEGVDEGIGRIEDALGAPKPGRRGHLRPVP